MSQRPDERLWQQLRAARSVPALLEAVRASRAASTVSGVSLVVDADAIELAFRQQMRTRIDEVARWSPDPWQSAIGYTRQLVDLPAAMRLLSDETPPRWMAADPVLAGYVHARASVRRDELRKGPLSEIVAGVESSDVLPSATAAETSTVRVQPRVTAMHRALAAWERAWRKRWPRIPAEAARVLEDLIGVLRRHLLKFGSIPRADTAVERLALANRLATLLRRASLQPTALFAYLALFALDLERLRAEFMHRARPVDVQPRVAP
jgi:hypothetical protein